MAGARGPARRQLVSRLVGPRNRRRRGREPRLRRVACAARARGGRGGAAGVGACWPGPRVARRRPHAIRTSPCARWSCAATAGLAPRRRPPARRRRAGHQHLGRRPSRGRGAARRRAVDPVGARPPRAARTGSSIRVREERPVAILASATRRRRCTTSAAHGPRLRAASAPATRATIPISPGSRAPTSADAFGPRAIRRALAPAPAARATARSASPRCTSTGRAGSRCCRSTGAADRARLGTVRRRSSRAYRPCSAQWAGRETEHRRASSLLFDDEVIVRTRDGRRPAPPRRPADEDLTMARDAVRRNPLARRARRRHLQGRRHRRRGRREGGAEIVGIGTAASRGLRKGVVVNIEATVEAIRKAVEEAELMAGCEIRSVVAGSAGSHIKGFNSHGVVAVKSREVAPGDVERVIDAARAVALPMDREVLHVLPQEFIVDDQDGIKEPVGMAGRAPRGARPHRHRARSARGRTSSSAAIGPGCTSRDVLAGPLAAAEAVLTPEERELGVALIDLGGGTTDVVVVQARGHPPHGGAAGRRRPRDQRPRRRRCARRSREAERLKQRYGCALARGCDDGRDGSRSPGVGGRAPHAALAPRAGARSSSRAPRRCSRW